MNRVRQETTQRFMTLMPSRTKNDRPPWMDSWRRTLQKKAAIARSTECATVFRFVQCSRKKISIRLCLYKMETIGSRRFVCYDFNDHEFCHSNTSMGLPRVESFRKHHRSTRRNSPRAQRQFISAMILHVQPTKGLLSRSIIFLPPRSSLLIEDMAGYNG